MTFLSTWTDDRIEQLKRLHAEGYSSSQIAAELGHATRNGVIGKIHRLGLTRDIVRARKEGPRAPRAAKKSANCGFNPFEARWQPKKPPVPIEIRCAAVIPFHLSEPAEGKCKYPYGEGPFTFCGHDTARTYCDLHHELCWIPTGRRQAPPVERTKPQAILMRVGGYA